MDSAAAEPFGVYVHWPFCLSKCPYCDFNSHVSSRIDHARWRAALKRELAHFRELTPDRTVSSIFFGGGTPSLMEPETVAEVIDEVRRLWPWTNRVEISLEANPTSVEAEKFAGFRQAGVNRVSLGIQALNDRDLDFLGRAHDAEQALGAIAIARENFERMSFDLIYSRPKQTVAAWRAELKEALALAADHISLYQLTIEPETPFFARHARGEIALPKDTRQAELYETTQEVLEAAGMPAYEVSNHARTGAECRHNLVYWRYHDYAGIGPGAHSRLRRRGPAGGTVTHAIQTVRAPAIWLDRVDRNGHGIAEQEPVGRAGRLTEMLMMGLRLSEGIERERLEAEAGTEIEALFGRPLLQDLEAAGYIEPVSDRLAATLEGRQRLNAVIAALSARLPEID
ncbi:radical SAM family heme chaperone HemW [Nisaea acidiphila]|uniref:Heme chaperone HemW n=1 Tax=Nisaea acidiphila TaxID=1862145 RepID=A0A9J7B0H9_9PROT|nr:radical SAM family heme chaperone HemW [Nisaea acidiphila]UUX52161.1 radical SAM family heme chaperone HemW [Nisaea acidiphila]